MVSNNETGGQTWAHLQFVKLGISLGDFCQKVLLSRLEQRNLVVTHH